jgi:hypothetical protein
MERAPQPVEERHPEPIPREPDLPTLSDTALMAFAAAALALTALALWLLLG